MSTLTKLRNFESHFDVTPPKAAEILGVAYTSYSEYRRGAQETPLYILYSIEAHCSLPREIADSLIKKRKEKFDYGSFKSYIDKVVVLFDDVKNVGPALGYAYTTFNEWRIGSRKPLKKVVYSIEAHLLLEEIQLDRLFRKRIFHYSNNIQGVNKRKPSKKRVVRVQKTNNIEVEINPDNIARNIAEFEKSTESQYIQTVSLLGIPYPLYRRYQNHPIARMPKDILFSIEAHSIVNKELLPILDIVHSSSDLSPKSLDPNIIKNFEGWLKKSPDYCAQLIGVDPILYRKYSQGKQRLPLVIRNGMQAHLALTQDQIETIHKYRSDNWKFKTD